MTIAFDQAVGHSETNKGSGVNGSVTLTTTAATAASCRIVVVVSYFDANTPTYSLSDSGGSYTLDKSFANGGDKVSIFSRVTASSLALSSVITLAWTGTNGGGGYLLAACSYTGTTAVDTSNNNTGTTAAAWTTGGLQCALADSLYVACAGTDGTIASESSTPGVGNERFDNFLLSDNQGIVMQDLIVSSVASNALTGTWGTTTGLTAQTMAMMIYKGTAAAAPAATVISPPVSLGNYFYQQNR